MNKLDKQYQALLQDILENGVVKADRTGTGTVSVFGRQIRHKMSEGFPLLTTKRMAWKSMLVELLWFLRGDTNIKFLLENGCNIWTGDAYKAYRKFRPHDEHSFTIEEFTEEIKTNPEFAKKYGDLGPIYGKQWRAWSGIDRENWINTDNITDPLLGGRGLFYEPSEVDQIANLISNLKSNPDSRRLMVSAWNVAAIEDMVLPPCHYGFQVYTRELTYVERSSLYHKEMKGYVNTDAVKTGEHFDLMDIPKRAISLMWSQRSCDVLLGAPFNIASYGLLLQMIAKQVNMIPEELIGNLGDTHLYSNHIEQAKEQITREPYALPQMYIAGEVEDIADHNLIDFMLVDYQSHPAIKAPLSN